MVFQSNLALKNNLSGFGDRRYKKNIFSSQRNSTQRNSSQRNIKRNINKQNYSNLNREFLSTYEKGISSEQIVMNRLKLLGYEILGHRIKTGYGEIDILAQKGTSVVAFEVKQRTTIDEAKACLSTTQQKRIAKALLYIVSERNKPFETYRIDVVCLDSVGRFEHIENAFSVDELIAC